MPADGGAECAAGPGDNCFGLTISSLISVFLRLHVAAICVKMPPEIAHADYSGKLTIKEYRMTDITPAPTTDLSDAFSDDPDAKLQYLAPGWRDFGGTAMFAGPAVTLSTLDDNTKVRAQVESPGHGRVLVVDGGASMACALFGGNLAQLAAQNGWAGVIINGCVRDTLELQAEPVGIKALATHPEKASNATLVSWMQRSASAASRSIRATGFMPMRTVCWWRPNLGALACNPR